MNAHRHRPALGRAFVFSVIAVVLASHAALAQSTAFTYQGELSENGAPAAGSFDMEFSLWDALEDGNQLCCPVAVNNVQVFDGRFTAQLDFGAAAFACDGRWLEIIVEGFTLAPRQEVTRTPYSTQTRGIFVDENGRVGIGTTGIPLGKLGIFTSDSVNGLHVENTFSSAFTDSAIYGIGTDAGGRFEATGTGNFTAAVLATSEYGFAGFFAGKGYFSGNVGIGTNTPNAKLDVNGLAAFEDTTFAEQAIFHGGARLQGGGLIVDGPNSSSPTDHSVSIYAVNEGDCLRSINDGNGKAARFEGDVVMTRGNVGIGTTDPVSPLHVDGGVDASPEDAASGYAVIGNTAGANLVMDNNEIMARNNGATSTLYLNNEGGDVRIGQNGGSTTVFVPVLVISGADLAEKFPITKQDSEALPGTVMEIDPDHPGKLRIARGAYNRRVAGVVSGAGDIPTGTILGNLPGSESSPAIALSGRVWVRCDATRAEIETGAMLTTSDTPGLAMAVSDFERAHGAVIGKAMTPLPQGGIGMVLVLINLQ